MLNLFKKRKTETDPPANGFQFGASSRKNLNDVSPKLIRIASTALELSPIDFGITHGLRTAVQQNALFKLGKSKCDGYEKISPHQEERAIDVVAYIEGKPDWDIEYYCEIADAFMEAAKIIREPTDTRTLRWGAAWHVHDLSMFNGIAKEAYLQYVQLRKSEGRQPFIDGVHFELYGK